MVGYNSNKLCVFDLNQKQLHEWSKKNLMNFPANFLQRYNRIQGILQLSTNKYLVLSHYTQIPLDLTQNLPKESLLLKEE